MTTQRKQVDVAIIGAGFAGLGTGIELKKAGILNFVIFEGEEGVGGSWRTNTYPGCACDVPSHLYSYSFAPNPKWPEAFSRQEDIRQYIEECASQYGMDPYIRFSTRVTDASFDEKSGRWIITTNDGQITEARVLVPATGALSHPKYPDIKGMDRFKGKALHAARWDPTVDLRGKHVGVIGSGASAIQVVPNVAGEVADLKVFQRTPSWVMPKFNRTFSDKDHRDWVKHPWKQKAHRLGLYWTMESALPAILWYPKLLKVGELMHKRALNKHIQDPALRRKLTPDYKVGCKRTLVSDDWFPAFARPNVHLITDGIKEITEAGVRTSDGVEHALDVIIYCTGYEIGAPAYPFAIKGIGGLSLADYWGGQSKAYYGMNVSHFPNMLLTMGPNSGPGHTSVLIYQEAQYKYIAKYTKTLLKQKLRYLDVKEEVMQEQFQSFQDRMRNSSWLSGCQSWYLNADGTNSTMWPGFSFEYVLRTRNMDMGAYNVVA
ncbi:MAG: NAD(P)/FAD-dependent oxidoreductase [Fluviicoccus sp.]|uniref:flavin-containing monooxygenase n=1 Tax=Fluviicoccus sp. TaxID=2003552 RepID=UPI00272729FF|nr:NAD(P)/FAD-dependent oxidoreductase [Fluviicoccus sp.]MDO8330592.1 NAD(P)/FAD-dependent oxidoreductase [Fluviicoccus sp.]